MSFIVDYKFHREKAKGEYDKEKVEEASIQVGSSFDDVPIDVLAGKIMTLLARRNILVVEINAFEIVKKPLNYKEMDDGIVIKNKKFKFDDGTVTLTSQNVDEAPNQLVVQPVQSEPQQTLPVKSQIPSVSRPNQRVIRYEIYNPENEFWIETTRKAIGEIHFTRGKRYPIYSEKEYPGDKRMGMLYSTTDDRGLPQIVSDKLFVLAPNLVVEGEVGGHSGLSDAGLSWGGIIDDSNIPEIRRR